MNRARLFAAVAAVAFLPVSAFAAATVYDGFNGAPTGFTDYRFNVTGPGASLSYATLQTSPGGFVTVNQFSGNQAALANPVTDANTRNSVYSNNGVVWLSWLYRTDSVASPWSRVVLFDNGAERYNIGHMDLGDLGGTGFHIRGNFFGQNNSGSPILPIPANSTYLLVAKFDYGTAASSNDGSVTVYVNPDPASIGTAAPANSLYTVTSTSNDDSLLNFTNIAFNNDQAGVGFDEFRLGATYADVTPFAFTTPTYIGTGGGSFTNPANWAGLTGFPNGVGVTAIFGSSITSNATVYSDTNVTLGRIDFDNANRYVLAGAGTLTLQTTTGAASIYVLSGSQKINLETTFASSTDITVASGSTLLLSDPVTLASGVTVTKNGPGALTFQSTLAASASAPATLKLNTGGPVSFDAGFNSPNINIIVDPATLNLGSNHTLGVVTLDLGGNTLNVGRAASGLSTPATLNATSLIVTHGTGNTLNTTLPGNSATFNAITIDAASSLTKTGPGTLATPVISSDGTVTVSAGTLRLTPGNQASYLAALSVTPGATLDLTNNTLVLLDGNLSGIRADFSAGRLSSSSINSNTTLAVFLNDAGDGATPYYTSYGSVTDLIATDVIVRYTYKGDLNLDGKVDGTDLAVVLEAYSTGIGSGWNFGDVNYDNLINAADISIILSQINANLPSLGFPTGGSAFGGGPVPEPAAIALILPTLAITSRKRR